jgi:putative oxidoreductase
MRKEGWNMSMALLIARLVLGLGIAAHGAQKLFGWFGGYGLAGTGGFFEGLGFRPGKLFAFGAGAGEFAGGLLLAVGLLGPVGPALMILVMTVAIGSVHWKNGFFVTSNGVEVPLLYAAAALILALTGPGAYSLDAVLHFGWLRTDAAAWLTVAIGLVGAEASLALRRRQPGVPAV